MHERNVKEILSLLEKEFPRINHPWSKKANPFKTLVSTILSAQTTDAQVDLVTPYLFRHYPTPAKLAKAKGKDVERIIKSVGLYKNKAQNIIKSAKSIVSDFNGRVPDTRESLMKLSGVGSKTANVVLIKAFGKPAMPVDTHVFRVANRIGLAHAKTPEDTEAQLVKIIPEQDLGKAHFWLINFGRTTCRAKKPLCDSCRIRLYCKYYGTKEVDQSCR